MNMKLSLVTLTSCVLLVALAATTTPGAFAATPKCTFEILVKTGGRKDSGTDARVSLKVSGARGPTTLEITNLESWGKMSAGHDYFERGNFDRFSGTGSCIGGGTGPCKMLLKSDGTGNKPGWYVEYVVVTQLPHGSGSPKEHKWAVDQWLALDEAPHKLFASRNGCGLAAP